MSSKFLLTCSCGRQHVVQPSQAGDRVLCECGVQLDVPTLRRLKTLPPAAEEATEKKQAAWGPSQGLMMSGAAILLLALVMTGYLYMKRPAPPELDVQRSALTKEAIQNVTLAQSWEIWLDFRERGLGDRVFNTVIDYEQKKLENTRMLTLAAALGAVGALVLLAGGVVHAGRK